MNPTMDESRNWIASSNGMKFELYLRLVFFHIQREKYSAYQKIVRLLRACGM